MIDFLFWLFNSFNLDNFNKAFEEREFSRAYTYIFDMVSQVML